MWKNLGILVTCEMSQELVLYKLMVTRGEKEGER